MAKKTVLPRRIKTGIAAAPIDSFRDFKKYIHTECEKKEIGQVVKTYIKQQLNKKDYELIIKNTPEYEYTSASWIASSALWIQKEFPFPANWNFEKAFNDYIADLKEKAYKTIERNKWIVKEEDGPVVVRKTPMEIIQEKSSEFIGEVEGMVDEYLAGNLKDYSMFEELKKADASTQQARIVADRFNKVKNELTELVGLPPAGNQSDFEKQLAEGYSFLKKMEQKAFLKFITNIVDDTEKFIGTKKAVRKTRVKKPKAADKQVSTVQYLKNSLEYKLASINPINIVGAMRVYLFNTKSRMITELVSYQANGFEVKGTTIQGFDTESSRSVKLRKPEDFLKIVMNKTPRQIGKEWDALTTKSTEANGRINKDTIIMRVADR